MPDRVYSSLTLRPPSSSQIVSLLLSCLVALRQDPRQPRLAQSSLLAEKDLELPNAPDSASQMLRSQPCAMASSIEVVVTSVTEDVKQKPPF